MPNDAEKRPVGAPTKYNLGAIDTVLRLGAEGASRAEWAAELGIAWQTLFNWEEKHPEFLDATTRARELAQAWWEKQGRVGIWEPKFNANAYRLQVMNRFPADWRDKREHEVSGPNGGPINVTRTIVDPALES